MSDPTATYPPTIANALDSANPNNVADLLQLVKLGRMLTPLKLTLTGLTSAAAINLTLLKAGASGIVVNSGQLNAGDALPPIQDVKTLRVTAGAATAGPRTIADSGATATAPAGANALPGVAKLSDDGTTITFDTTVTAFVIEYIPRPYTDLTTSFGM